MTNDPNGPAHNPDPDADGGDERGVRPGETPPASDQTSAPQGHDEQGPPRGIPLAWMLGMGVVVALVAALFIGLALGVLG